MVLTICRMKEYWKWLVIATVLILVPFGFIFGLAFACRKRSAQARLGGGAHPSPNIGFTAAPPHDAYSPRRPPKQSSQHAHRLPLFSSGWWDGTCPEARTG
jgi:hypothetical protein